MHRLSLARLGADLRAKRYSSVELAREHLARIDRHQRALNAFITVDAEATLAQARVLASKGARLIYVQPAIARGTLRVTLDVYPVTSNGWDRARDPAPAPSAHAFVESPLDGEVRAFLTSIPLEHASVHRARHDEGEVLAAACGDLDGDGGMELVLASRERVAVGHLVGGKFTPTRTAAWSALAPRAPVPLREPLAGATIVTEGDRARLLVGITDRGGLALDAGLARLSLLRGIPVEAASDACAIPDPPAGAFEGDVFPCAPESVAAPRFTPPAARYDAVASFDLVRPDGSARPAHAAREPGGKLAVRLGDASVTLEGVGAQVALADLDQDGELEVIGSGLAQDEDDAVTIWSWDGRGDPRERMKLPAPGGVRAICACPPEAGGVPALIAVVEGEVWLVR